MKKLYKLTFAIFISLTLFSNYEWQVQAYSPPPSKCSAPAGLSSSSVTNNSANLSWNAVGGATSYTIQYRISGSATWTTTTSATNSKSISSLAPSTSYNWRLQTICSSGSSKFSSSANFTTQSAPTPCNVTSNLSSSAVTETTANLSWNAVSGAVGYTIQYRVVGSGLWSTTTSATNSKSLSLLTPASNYEWQVQTSCSSNSSSFTSSANFSTLASPCNMTSGLSSSAVTETTVNLSWNAVSGAVGYTIQYRVVGSALWSTTTSATNSKSLSLLTPASNYEWQVQTNCSSNSSSFTSSANFTTLTPSCNMTSGLSSTAVTETAANLSWSAVSGAAGYTIQYRVVGSASWLTTTSAANSKSLSLLTPASNYEWQVQTNCSSNSSSFTSSANFTTLTPPCNTPGSLNAGSIGTTTATLSWSSVSGAVTYNIQYRTIGGSWSSTTSATNSKGLTGLISGKTYEWKVQTVCQFSNSTFSASSSFTTTNTAVILVRNAYLQMVSATAVNIRWRTDIARTSRVRIGITMGYGITVDSSTSTTEHEVRITGLSPNTKYFYTIGSSTLDLQGDPNYFVKTALPAGNTSAFRVWATGDFGKGSAGQDAVTASFVNYTSATTPADMWIWLGDNAYNGGLDAELTTNVFSKYPNQFRNIPVYPCLGNHDYGSVGYQSASALGTNFAYFNSFSCPRNAEAGGVASNSEKYYSYNHGNVHFITLDSYGALNAAGSAMYNWLQADLIANTQRWTVVNWHHPPYSMGTHNSDTETEMLNMRNNIVPLLETYKVDLVLCGHSHTYERSFLLKGHFGLESTLTAGMKIDAGSGNAPYYQKSSPNFYGTVYAVVGVSGQGGSVSTQTSWPHAAMYSNAKTLFGSMIIDFNNDTLDAKFLASGGSIYDQFKIVKVGTSRLGSNVFFEENLSEEDLVVYPNPFSNETMLRYKVKEPSPVNVEIFDMTGSRVYSYSQASQDAGFYEIAINSESLQNKKGIFIVRVLTNSGVFNKTIERLD